MSDGCLVDLPETATGIAGADAVRLIDVLWFTAETKNPAAALEVEHTTSIYSGIVRLLDLALGMMEIITISFGSRRNRGVASPSADSL